MKAKQSTENYLETILILFERNGTVRSIDIANELGFSKPSVSVATKKLRALGYIEVDSHGAITLTPSGAELAKSIYERHKVLSSFLISIGVSKDQAMEDACLVEHIISEETFEHIKDFFKNRKQ